MIRTGSDCPCGHSEQHHRFAGEVVDERAGCRACSCDLRAFEVQQGSASVFSRAGDRAEWRSLPEHLRWRKS